ncbi:MAG: hypothetical protein ACOYU0_09350 [Nitrospirota bacterium]
MTEPLSKYVIFHGAIIISIGLFSGLIYWQTIIRNKRPEVIRGWRIAHVFLVIEGMFIVIVGLDIPHLALSGLAVRLLVWIIISSGYGFVLAFIGSAWKGYRGLTPKPYGLNTILFLGHFIGAGGSLIGIAMVIYGSFKAI